jgi:hypothetical protein
MKCEAVKGTMEAASSTILESAVINSTVLLRCENQTMPTKICQRNNKTSEAISVAMKHFIGDTSQRSG